MKQALGLFLIIFLGACQIFTRPDTPATLRAQNAGFIIEATAIAQTAQAREISVERTAIAASTAIARMDNVNLQLRATARVVIPPTPQIAGGGLDAGTAGDGMNFVEFGTASSVRDSDGCATSLQTVFPSDIPTIYITARTFNIRAATVMKVEWHYQGNMVHEESFVVPADDNDYCVWFNIDPNVTPFLPGSWTVRLYAIRDESQRWIDSAFIIEGAMLEGG